MGTCKSIITHDFAERNKGVNNLDNHEHKEILDCFIEAKEDFVDPNIDIKVKELRETLSSVVKTIRNGGECRRDDMMGTLFLLFMIGNEIPPEEWFRDLGE